MHRGKTVAGVVLVLLAIGGGLLWYVARHAELDPYVALYAEQCAQCHNDTLLSAEAGGFAKLGEVNVAGLQQDIKHSHALDQFRWQDELDEVDLKGLAIYIAERRLGQRFTDFRFDRDITIPADPIVSDEHSFVLETVAEGLAPLVFSIEPLPNGSLLVTEKEAGLLVIAADGSRLRVEGTPQAGSSLDIRGVQFGSGWLLDVAVHPDYQDNGWIYLHYTELCGEDCDIGLLTPGFAASSMNRLDRGRIADGKWVDVETLWQAPHEFYTAAPDTGAGGRIAFDDSGHVFISVGIKSNAGLEDTTAQDLMTPYGKIHRLRDDGAIPLDNPFVMTGASVVTAARSDSLTGSDSGAVRDSIWTYGHRSPQGLEWHPLRHRVWNSEMGPRGGDELNELLPGRNFGWPFQSHGLEYVGKTVERHKAKAIEFDDSDVEDTLVDITPSPAISSFVFYAGDRFPRWQNNVLIGSLKGSSLYRMVFDGRELKHQETLIRDLARIRDVEVGFDGLIYLLLESAGGSKVVRMVPATS